MAKGNTNFATPIIVKNTSLVSYFTITFNVIQYNKINHWFGRLSHISSPLLYEEMHHKSNQAWLFLNKGI